MEEIIVKVREVEVVPGRGQAVVEACRKIGVTEQIYYRWRREYGGLRLDQAKRFKELEQENAGLNKLVADLSLDKAILKEAASGNSTPQHDGRKGKMPGTGFWRKGQGNMKGREVARLHRRDLPHCFRLALVAAVLVFCGVPGLGGVAAQEPRTKWTYTVKKEHPRIWITPERLRTMREHMKNNTPDWQAVKKTADRAPIGKSFGDCYAYVVPTALCYQVYKDVDPEKAKEYAEKCYNVFRYAVEKPDPPPTRDKEEKPGSPVDQVLDNLGNAPGYAARGTLLTIPVAYDWLYDYLTPEQRKNIAHKLSIWCDWANKNAYSAGGIGNFPVSYFVGEAYAGIATSHEDPDAERHLVHSWETYQNVWRKSMVEGSLKDGGIMEGAGYGGWTAQVIMDLFAAWKGATGYNPAHDLSYPRNLVHYLIYATVPALDRIYMDGDTETNGFIEPVYSWNVVLMGADMFRSEPLGGHAQWWVNHVKTTPRHEPDWHRLLWRDPKIGEKPLDDLPTLFAAESCGMVFDRSDWKTDATFVSFHCGPRLPGGHLHNDQGHFSIYRNGWLVPETASYEQGHGSDRHNTLLVGPNDYGYGKTIWGQMPTYDQEPRLLGVESGGGYGWMRGDAASSYNWSRVATKVRVRIFDRQVAFLKPDYVVVFDRVTAEKPEYKKTMNFCFGLEPKLEGSTVEARPIQGTGLVRANFLLPKEATLEKQSIKSEKGADSMNSWWRVGVTPKEARAEDLFLSAFQACENAQAPPAAMTLIEGTDFVGARVGPAVVIFSKNATVLRNMRYQVEMPAKSRHLVTGLPPGQTAVVAVNGKEAANVKVSQQGLAYYELPGAGKLSVEVVCH